MSEVITLRYALDPSPAQTQQLSSHVGAVRYAYNWAVTKIYENWEDYREGRTTEYMSTSMRSLRALLNVEKHIIAPWYSENSKDAFESGLSRVSMAYSRYFKKISEKPVLKKRGHGRESITFSTNKRELVGSHHFKLPRLGVIRLHENSRKARWLVKQGARITNCTVSYAQTRWFLSITFKVEPTLFIQYNNQRTKKDRERVVGLDLGISSTLVSSDGLVISNPRAFEKSLRKLKRAQKSLSRKRSYNKDTGEAPSKRYEKQRKVVAKKYARVYNVENDTAHKISKTLVDKYENIVIEDLNIMGMIKNKRLSRHIAHAMWGKLKLNLMYKTKYYDGALFMIDRYYPSSKLCSNCARVKTTLSLSERTYHCDCGQSIDRDYNAALNIRNVFTMNVTPSCEETLNGRGGAGKEYYLLNTRTNKTSSYYLPKRLVITT